MQTFAQLQSTRSSASVGPRKNRTFAKSPAGVHFNSQYQHNLLSLTWHVGTPERFNNFDIRFTTSPGETRSEGADPNCHRQGCCRCAGEAIG